MTCSNNSWSFFVWKLEPKFSWGFFTATILIVTVLGSIWKMFPGFYSDNIAFAIIHHSLALITLILMFISSWASPGRVQLSEKESEDCESQRCNDIIKQINSNAQINTVNGISKLLC